MNLCHLIGKPLTTQVHVSGDFPEIEKDLEVQVLDITRRPEYGILDTQVAIARQQVKLNRSELLPKVGIKGSYDYVPVSYTHLDVYKRQHQGRSHVNIHITGIYLKMLIFQ